MQQAHQFYNLWRTGQSMYPVLLFEDASYTLSLLLDCKQTDILCHLIRLQLDCLERLSDYLSSVEYFDYFYKKHNKNERCNRQKKHIFSSHLFIFLNGYSRYQVVILPIKCKYSAERCLCFHYVSSVSSPIPPKTANLIIQRSVELHTIICSRRS